MTTNRHSEQLLRISSAIVHTGFALVPAGAGRCAVPGCGCDEAFGGSTWSYTIGLAEQGLPELVIVGLSPFVGLQLVTWVHREARAGRPLLVGQSRTLGSIPVRLDPIPALWLAQDPDRMRVWFEHYLPGRSSVPQPPVAQLVWGDAESRFPDELGCDPFVAEAQPLIASDPFSFPMSAFRPARRSLRRSRAA